jgi:ABC-type nitrate/sulfonate/bicarbonate transport system substrate-binding protein
MVKLMKLLTYLLTVVLSSGIEATGFLSPPYSAEAASKKITIAYASFVPSTVWFLLEKDLGFFRAEGLNPEFILVTNSGVAIKGLIAGNFDYITPTGTVTDPIIRSRVPLKLAFTALQVHYSLIARPEIRSFGDLRGKRIGIASIGSSNDLILRETLRQHGIDPIKDTSLLAISSSSRDRFAALTAQGIDATFLSSPFDLKALEMGYRSIARASDYVKWPQAGLATTDLKIQQEPQEAAKMVRAALKGLKFALAQKNYVISKSMQMFRLSREEASHSYEALQEEMVPTGYLSEREQQTTIAIVKQGANVLEDIPSNRVFDYRFVKQAEQELKGWQPQAPNK